MNRIRKMQRSCSFDINFFFFSCFEFDRHARLHSLLYHDGARLYSGCNLAVGILCDAVTYYCLWCAERFPRPSDRPTDGSDDESTEANSRNGVGCIIELFLFLFFSNSEQESRPPRYPEGALSLARSLHSPISPPGDNISANTDSGNPLASARLPPVRVMP